MITGGFGIVFDTQRGTLRNWQMGADGVRRWTDDGEAVDVDVDIDIDIKAELDRVAEIAKEKQN